MATESQNIVLDIISPEATLVHASVASVELPGTAGRFEILKNHAPLISSLEKGEIRYVTEGGDEARQAIKSGFVEVCDNRVTACVEL